jgi:hypothetical protein
MSMLTMDMTQMFHVGHFSRAAELALGATAVLVLFSFFNHIRMCTSIDIVWCFVVCKVAVHSRLSLATLSVMSARVMMVMSLSLAAVSVVTVVLVVFSGVVRLTAMSVVMCLMTFHWSTP